MSDENNIVEPEIKVNKDIVNLNIEVEMQNSYLDYAMSVIVGRALPDVRDGLKPVHRRILFSMNEQNILHNKPYVKSARVVGDVMGKYHPHGDLAIYNTMVRMAQNFSMRYELIDGQGNFGSIDGDSPAAMRYTESRLAKLSSDLLIDIDKDTVNFAPNYDDKLKEPTVLPTRIPNLLINGSTGIAVGMATHIPPHNLTEVISALKAIIANPDIKDIELLKHVKGPDFPTAGFICGRAGIVDAYTKGRGVIKMRAKAEIEEIRKDKEAIIVTEIPYTINKANLIIQIADLVRNKRIEGISDIRDESDLNGMRIVIEVKKGAPANIILNNLYKFTALQSSFGIILLALTKNTPKIFTLKEMLEHFIAHRKEVVIRRTQFELNKAHERAHILEGLKIAVENIDEVITLIKASQSPDEAKEKLKEKFELSSKQATAILEMRLQKLTGLERDNIIEEYKNILELIKKLKTILASETLIYNIIGEELDEMKEKYGDNRKTQIIEESTDIDIEDILSDDQVVITRTHKGYIKRSSISDYKNQKRGGKGVLGISTRDEDFVETIFTTSNHSSLLIFTNLGRIFNLKVHKVPQASRTAKGIAIVNLLELASDEKPMTVLSVREFKEGDFVFLVTSKGVVKKMDIMHFEKVMKKGILAIKLKDEEVISAKLINSEDQNIFIGTKEGQSIRFEQQDLRDMGRTARGVRGINLASEDIAVGSETLEPSGDELAILTITEKGYGKRTKLDEYRVQSRGGKGVKTLAVTEKTGNVVSMKQVSKDDEIMVMTNTGNIIRMNVNAISLQGRNTQGVRVVRLKEGEFVAGVAKIEMEEKVEKENDDVQEQDLQNMQEKEVKEEPQEIDQATENEQ